MAHLLATLAVGGLAGVATFTTSLSANECPFGRLLEGWHSGAERPKKVLRSISFYLQDFALRAIRCDDQDADEMLIVVAYMGVKGHNPGFGSRGQPLTSGMNFALGW